jgi:hypothetical protein
MRSYLNEKQRLRYIKPRLTAVWIRCADLATAICPQKFALTSPTSGGWSVGVVRLRTKATEYVFYSVDNIIRLSLGAGHCIYFVDNIISLALGAGRHIYIGYKWISLPLSYFKSHIMKLIRTCTGNWVRFYCNVTLHWRGSRAIS